MNKMKKIIIAAAICSLSLALCACSNSSDNKTSSAASTASSSVSDTSEKASETSTEESAVSTDTSAADTSSAEDGSELAKAFVAVKKEVTLPEDMSDFTTARIKRVFGITDEQMTDFAGAVCTNGVRQDQIIYFKAKDEASADYIAEKLQDNWQATYNVIQNYDPDQMSIIENAKVERDGLYVSLVMSADADKIKEIFKENINK